MIATWLRPLAGAAAAAVLLAAGPALAAPAIWAVRDEDSTIYLMGSVHVVDAGLEWGTPLLDRIYAEADEIWLETVFEDGATGLDLIASEAAVKAGHDPDGRLEQLLGEARFKRLVDGLAPFALPVDDIRHFRPWYASRLLEIALENTAPEATLVPVGMPDSQLEMRAREDGKRLRSLESFSDHVGAWARIDEATQANLLGEWLDNPVADPVTWRAEAAAWVGGDEQALAASLAVFTQRYPALHGPLLRDRNHAWTDLLANEMRGSGVDFVMAGVLHMAGEDGLPALLRARGFKVERVQ